MLALAGLALLMVSACSSSDEFDPDRDRDRRSSDTTASPPTSGDDGPGDTGGDADPDLDPSTAELLADLQGQLAIVSGPAVAVARPDGRALKVVAIEGETAAQPTWSRDGTALAWSSTSPARQVVLVQPFDADGQPDGDPEISQAAGSPIFYLQWDHADQELAYLRRASQRGQVEFGVVEPGRQIEPLGEDTPFFVAWSPGEARVLAHVAENRVELHDPAAPAPDAGATIALDQGADYSAPAWVDAERAIVVADDALALLTVADGTIDPIESIDGPVRFVVSPDGRRVAYRLLGLRAEEPLTAGLRTVGLTDDDDHVLAVIDLETGERQVVGDGTAAAWEWSPDGSRLAWLSVQPGARLEGRWSIWSADGTATAVEHTPDFGLTQTHAHVYLPFFAQYAQSVTGWAPDGSAFAFAGSIGRDRGIWIQLVDEVAPPQLVSTGDYVTWGPGPTPVPDAGPAAA